MSIDLVGAGAALLGAGIGGLATWGAAIEAFNRRARREDEAWRKALHYEFEYNMTLLKDRSPAGLWLFDTRVLRESFPHAAGLSEGALYRMILARANNEALEEEVQRLNAKRAQGITTDEQAHLSELRMNVVGEFRNLANELEHVRARAPK